MLISQRANPGGSGHLAYAAWTEAEDALATCLGIEIHVLNRDTRSRSIRVRRVLGRAARRVAGPDTLLPATGREPRSGFGDHVIFIAHGLWDLPLLERLRGIRRSGTSVSVWVSELWPNELQDRRIRHECFALVDHLFVTTEEVADPLTDIAAKAQIHVLPPAADVLRFAPTSASGQRGIAVLGIGRRDTRQHAEILDWSRRREKLYVYDTVQGRAVNWEEHRDALASYYRHSNVAICNYARHDMPNLTQGFRQLPGRLFEGLASGAVLVGMAPDLEKQQKLLSTSVVEDVEISELSLPALLDHLEDPETTRPIRTRNLALACRGHDWGHRWKTILETLSLPVPTALRSRLDELAKRADEYEQTS